MNHIDRINQILEYIEAHLDANLDLSLLAAKSALSKYHFHRKVFKTKIIPENDYAVFTHQGSVHNIEMTYDQIYGNWLPRSEYTPTMDLDVSVVDIRFSGRDEKSELDILIPVTC